MAKIILKNSTTPSTPNVGTTAIYADENDGHLKIREDNGNIIDISSGSAMNTPEVYSGADLVGNQLTTILDAKMVIMERQMLIPNFDYSVSGKIITFSIDVELLNSIVVYG